MNDDTYEVETTTDAKPHNVQFLYQNCGIPDDTVSANMAYEDAFSTGIIQSESDTGQPIYQKGKTIQYKRYIMYNAQRK